MLKLPFLTSYDPPGANEGTLDPLGLYQIADQLAVQLVPAVRERMQRIRFLTAMTVGAFVTEGVEGDPRQRDASPFLVWEWLVVEAMVRHMRDDPALWGVPGTLVTRRALDQQGYLDAHSYLKTPRVFGFNGVYKRLAIHLGLVNVHLGPGPAAEGLVDAWAHDLRLGGLEGVKTVLSRWRRAVRKSLEEKIPKTKTGRGSAEWLDMARAFAPGECKRREKRYLRNLLLSAADLRLGAMPKIWKLQSEFTDGEFKEEALHRLLKKRHPAYVPLLNAIKAYEAFARSLEDAFDMLKAKATQMDARGFVVPDIARVEDYRNSVQGLHGRYEAARHALAQIGTASLQLESLFERRFESFAEPMDAAGCAFALCNHHEVVQREKSAAGKRPWFDRLGHDRIYIRHAYRDPPREVLKGKYVHAYRGHPIRRFWSDLS